MRRVIVTAAVLGVGAAAFLLMPGPVDSVAWTPPPAPAFGGATAVNDRLTHAQVVISGEIVGPEDVAVDPSGGVYAGMQDGRIARISLDGTVETVANTGGRPLGLAWDPAGNLIVADAYKGLLSMTVAGKITVLTTQADGVAFAFTDDVDVATDGRIYFSDASSKFSQADYALDLLEARPYGRLMVYDPFDQSTTVLLDGLYFANGVALSAAEDFVLVNETWRYQVRRYWLKGARAGTSDIFVDNLPGFPDGISGNGRGTFWLALASPRKANVDALYPKPWLKNLVAKLPEFLRPRAVRYGLALALDENGTVVASYHDPTGANVWEVTSVEEHAGHLYFGSLTTDRIARLALTDPP